MRGRWVRPPAVRAVDLGGVAARRVAEVRAVKQVLVRVLEELVVRLHQPDGTFAKISATVCAYVSVSISKATLCGGTKQILVSDVPDIKAVLTKTPLS